MHYLMPTLAVPEMMEYWHHISQHNLHVQYEYTKVTLSLVTLLLCDVAMIRKDMLL